MPMLDSLILTLVEMTEGDILGPPPIDMGWPARAKELVLERAPTIVSGLAIVLVGWLGALFVRALVRRLLGALQLDRVLAGTRLATLVGALGKDLGPARLI